MFLVPCFVALLLSNPASPEQSPVDTPLAHQPLDLGADAARDSIKKAVKWIVDHQRENGAWGTGSMDSFQVEFFSVETHYAFQVGANALACRAMLMVDETPERRKVLEKGVEWLCTTGMPKRGSDWDIDCSWSALYGFDACVWIAQDPRFQAEPWKSKVEKRGKEFYTLLEKNQEPKGGWGYYEGPVVSQRPTWSTSFSTASVVPALVASLELGWGVDKKLVDRAVAYVERCALPNGAYEYDLRPIPRVFTGESINNIKGSLGRIQVCNLARRAAGDKRVTDERIKEGLDHFLDNHMFLDAARLKPVPHESYYANAAYFYNFGHCYAALVAQQLPREDRERYQARLRPHLVKVQFKEGSTYDFIGNSWAEIAGTSFLVIGLQAGLAP